ncbi:carboxymuconolactone decarboxylase family protein [Shimia marina]|uniref:Putative peroxidase-related enzyme n=1 Tax=Shimia marina TaxID=321267 RepID=A0A0P1EJN0_9RHOB|nr:carboxymuconolactone decarboxylase family protein [Shimia marina]CUH50731.1 putative peroxidase-related enzyme [Shimia marina]SFE35628.1 alkylhydroperoxidase AhpD family core domain-containing protein [Shimia marina]
MTDFPTHSLQTAPEAAKPIMENAVRGYGFLPNLYAKMAESPAILEGYISLAGSFARTHLTETERQIILMTCNRLNGCQYCMAAHTTLSQLAGVDPEVIAALRSNRPLADAKFEALRQFVIVMNETRGWPSEADIAALVTAGYGLQTVLDVILGMALKMLSNYTSHVADTELDAKFQDNVWTADFALAAE